MMTGGHMKKRTIKPIICIMLASLIALGAGSAMLTSNAAGATTSTVSNLKKLSKIVKKKKKLSKVYKTEEAGTGSLDWLYYKHKASITVKGNKIYFKDHIYYKQRKLTIGEYNVRMVMNAGSNKLVKVSVTETRYKYRWVSDWDNTIKSAKKGKTLPKKTLTLNPSVYKYSKSYEDEKFAYHSEYHAAMRCWNRLLKKYARLNMKKIGFKKFKSVSISDDGYYCNK